MEKFNYSGNAEILHLNTRKEGPDEDKVLAADVKLRVVTDKSVMNFFEPLLSDVLFLDSGAVRNIRLNPITFSHELEHYHLETFGRSFVGCKVKRFELAPKDVNQITLTFQVSFKPSGDEVARLAEFLQDSVAVRIEPETGDLLKEEK